MTFDVDRYRSHCAERAAVGLPPLPLDAPAVQAVVASLRQAALDADVLVDLLAHRVPIGVDDAAKGKADFLSEVAHGT